MLKKVGIFLGIKYEPLSDPPVIKICGCGPWVPRSSNSQPCILAHYPVGNLFGDVFPFFCFIFLSAPQLFLMRRGKGLSLLKKLHGSTSKISRDSTWSCDYKELIKSSRHQKFCLTVAQNLLSISSI